LADTRQARRTCFPTSNVRFNAASVSVSGSGNTLTLTFPITFASSFIGPNSVYGTALDKGGVWCPYQQLGTWTAYAAPYTQLPSGLSVSPGSGTGTSQLFTFHASDLNGSGYIPAVQVIVNSSVNGANACFFDYSRAAAWIGLANNANTAWGASGYLGSSAVLSNSQCSINLAQSSASFSGNDLYLNVAITFASGFTGAIIYWKPALKSLAWLMRAPAGTMTQSESRHLCPGRQVKHRYTPHWGTKTELSRNSTAWFRWDLRE
jgi:hypothetical protein